MRLLASMRYFSLNLRASHLCYCRRVRFSIQPCQSISGTRISEATALHFCSSRFTVWLDHSAWLNKLFLPKKICAVSCRSEKMRPFGASAVLMKMSGAWASTSVKARNSLISRRLRVLQPTFPPLKTNMPHRVS